MTHSATIAPPELDELCVNTLRFLAVDAVQKAKLTHKMLRQVKEKPDARRNRREPWRV